MINIIEPSNKAALTSLEIEKLFGGNFIRFINDVR
tara:strand:+ start:249 stop:353 length:105 start_codon:yes stop_codon:yes gene_type:complete